MTPKKICSIVWDLKWAAQAMNLDCDLFIRFLKDGRFLNTMVTCWLCNTQKIPYWVPKSDGNSGLYLTDYDPVAKRHLDYRLRIAGETLSLSPSGNRGKGRHYEGMSMESELMKIAGFVVVFVAELPEPGVWVVPKDSLTTLQGAGLLNSAYSGSSEAILRYFQSVDPEGTNPQQELFV